MAKHTDRLDADLVSEVEELLDAIDNESLPNGPPKTLREFADRTLSEPRTQADREFAGALDRVLLLSHGRTGFGIALHLWNHRSPTFLKFEAADRDLKAAYAITEKGKPTWNEALHNLARFSGLDLDALLTAAGNHDLRQSLLDRPNKTIEDKLSRQWQQHRVTVRLSMNGNTLHVSAYDLGLGNYLPISARSEGLRQFVAITTFVDAKRARPGSPAPVLLLDEAEQHLHYDAQADLINVLVAQSDISKVVYTTHSAGCLPPDIGTGVRALKPFHSPGAPGNADPDLTRPVNNVWRSDDPGYGPLLLLMGAGAFAFTAARRAAVTEGFTDLLLLPTLVREATGEQRLDYQVVPGISATPNAGLPKLREAAVNVAYLVDGDDAGRAHADRIHASGIPRKRIVSFGKQGPCAPEDAVRADVFLEAVNQVLADDGIPPMTADGIQNRCRWTAVKDWAASHHKNEPGKKALALALLEHRDDGLLDGLGKRRIKAVHAAVKKALTP